MTHANKTMTPIYFGNDPVDTKMLIRINPEIQIPILDHILALAEFALSECFCSIILVIWWWAAS